MAGAKSAGPGKSGRSVAIEGVTVTRGIQRMWDARVWGTLVGAIGATVFVLVNRTDLETPWPTVARSSPGLLD